MPQIKEDNEKNAVNFFLQSNQIMAFKIRSYFILIKSNQIISITKFKTNTFVMGDGHAELANHLERSTQPT